MSLQSFIDENFSKSVKPGNVQQPDRLTLPYPYTVPSPGDMFDCMFYWDTHFTNVGLLATGDIRQAIHNVDNIRYVIETLGYMPNSTNVVHLGQSQPPFYYRMVLDIYEITKDSKWLATHYDTITKEHRFWMENRLAPNGLNFYGCEVPQNDLQKRYLYCSERFGGLLADDPAVQRRMAATVGTLCESGWDCCYRFELDGMSYNPVDLNALLYGLEAAMARFSEILGRGEDKLWTDRAAKRKEKMYKYLFSKEKGFYLDWNFTKKYHSPLVSAASLFPLYLGLEHDPKCLMEYLKSKLLLPYGVSGTEIPNHSYCLQWEYPNIWAPVQYVAVQACINAGDPVLADTIAGRYMELLESNYALTNNLWEKYNGITGQVVNIEYDAPPMLGWTAGVYLALKKNQERFSA